MADTEQQVGMLEETQAPHTQVLVENGEIVSVAQTHEADNVGMGEDILQQALDEASGAYDNTDVEYTTEENIAVVADGNGTLSDANGVTYSYVTAVPTETQLETQTITQAIPTAHTTQPGQSLIRINPNAQTHVTGLNQVVALPQTQSPNTAVTTNQQQQQQPPPPPPPPPPPQTPHVVQVIRRPQQVVQQVIQPQTMQPNIMEAISPQIQQTHVQLSQTDAGTPGSITVLTNSGVGGEPLGSSGNPIRIIQQGNKYTSVQQLTPEQVAQIMQVVQQQQLAQTTKAGGGSSVLFNPQTQTRIVYRVIYPSELHSKTTSASGTSVLSAAAGKTMPKTITVPTQMLTLGSASTSGPSSSSTRRPYRKRLKDEDDKVDGPALTREEKELRKKHRPRTRSGRVSRPPKHMIQDYKHIHHLDWEEDQDDSDGGYSDYKITDDEDGEKRSSLESALLDTNLNSSKPKKFSCEKCEKAYIGAAGLARHYRLNPDHGNAEDVCPAVVGKAKLSLNGVDGLASLADDSSTQDSISSTASLPTTMASVPVISTPIALPTISTTEALSEAQAQVQALTGLAPNMASASAPTLPEPVVLASPSKAAVPRGAARAKQHYVQENTPTRRKFRLKELVRLCTDEELMEVVLPRLSRVITTWEFLLMKVERGRPSRPHIGDMLTEYESLHKQVEKMCGDYLHPLPDPADGHVERHNNVLQMKNAVLAESLGLNMGKYSVREVPKRDESARQYKLITTSQNVGPGSGKRAIQLVTPDQLVIADNPAKRQRISEPCITSVSQTSGIVTVSLANKVFSDEAKLTAEPASESVVPSFSQSQAEVHATSQSSSTMLVNIAVEVPNTISDKNVLAEVTPHVIMAVGSEELNAVSVHDDDVLGSDMKAQSEEAETIISIATGHGPVEDSIAGADMDVCSSALPESMQVDDQGMTDSEMPIPANEEPGEVPASTCTATELTPADPVLVPAENGSTDQLEQVVQVQQAGDDGVISQQQDEQLHSQVLCEMADSGDAPVQTVMVAAGVGEQQTTQQVLSEDGQTVLYTNDGGQTFYQQAADMVTDQAQSQQMTMEASGPQFVSMETPEGLVEGQLVTNEDGTQFLIPHQETQDQAVYQTPEGFIVIQNQDGTLRILSNGDPQIPLETVQALLAGESQIEENTMEQAT